MDRCDVCGKTPAVKKCDVCNAYYVCDSEDCQGVFDLLHLFECSPRPVFISMKRNKPQQVGPDDMDVDTEPQRHVLTTDGSSDHMIYDFVNDVSGFLTPSVADDGFFTYPEVRRFIKMATLSHTAYHALNAERIGRNHIDFGRLIIEAAGMRQVPEPQIADAFIAAFAERTEQQQLAPPPIRSIWRDMVGASETLTLGFPCSNYATLFRMMPNIRHVMTRADRYHHITTTELIAALKNFPRLESLHVAQEISGDKLLLEPRVTTATALKTVMYRYDPNDPGRNLGLILPESTEYICCTVPHPVPYITGSRVLDAKAVTSISSAVPRIYHREMRVVDGQLTLSDISSSTRILRLTSSVRDPEFAEKLSLLKNLRVLSWEDMTKTPYPPPDTGDVQHWINDKTPVYPSIEAIALRSRSENLPGYVLRNIHRIFPNLRSMSLNLYAWYSNMYELFGDAVPMFDKLEDLNIGCETDYNEWTPPSLAQAESMTRFCEACDMYCTARLRRLTIGNLQAEPFVSTCMCRTVTKIAIRASHLSAIKHLPMLVTLEIRDSLNMFQLRDMPLNLSKIETLKVGGGTTFTHPFGFQSTRWPFAIFPAVKNLELMGTIFVEKFLKRQVLQMSFPALQRFQSRSLEVHDVHHILNFPRVVYVSDGRYVFIKLPNEEGIWQVAIEPYGNGYLDSVLENADILRETHGFPNHWKCRRIQAADLNIAMATFGGY
jgi:hypothetical protein